MRIQVNGEPVDVVMHLEITALLQQLRFPIDAVAVAVNGEVVPRRVHATRQLVEGDRVEVIRAVGGG